MKLHRTIAKFVTLVILIFAAVAATSCSRARSTERETPNFHQAGSPFREPKTTGRIESEEIDESSGLGDGKSKVRRTVIGKISIHIKMPQAVAGCT
ncbi:MAG: hypothetical protein LC734_06270 [Acidobacteria bacterium]|nr:hypothetical protein [Acidobacteriota bacterium]